MLSYAHSWIPPKQKRPYFNYKDTKSKCLKLKNYPYNIVPSQKIPRHTLVKIDKVCNNVLIKYFQNFKQNVSAINTINN